MFDQNATLPPIFSARKSQPTIVEQVIDTIANSLIEGKLKPGQQLPSEKEMAETLGVGRNAIREATKVLQALGVVEVHHGTGTFVANDVSPHMLNPLVFALLIEANWSTELVEMRLAVELGYYVMAAKHANDDDWDKIEQTIAAMETMAKQEMVDPAAYAELDMLFHEAVLEATHNPLIIKIGRTIERMFYPALRAAFANPENHDDPLRNHRQIVDAMRSGDLNKIHAAVNISLLDSPVRGSVRVPRDDGEAKLSAD